MAQRLFPDVRRTSSESLTSRLQREAPDGVAAAIVRSSAVRFRSRRNARWRKMSARNALLSAAGARRYAARQSAASRRCFAARCHAGVAAPLR